MTDIRKVFGQIGSSNPEPSMPELLHREFAHGRINKDEYDTANAVWVASNVDKYQARRYPALGSVAIEYAMARAGGNRDSRDEAMHRRIGQWTYAVHTVLDQNDADRSLLVWCLRICQEKKLASQVASLGIKLSQFDVPAPAHLPVVLAAQELDTKAKIRGGTA